MNEKLSNYYRLALADSWNDGDSWSVNQWYDQPYLIKISDNADSKAIIKAIKRTCVNKYLKNNRFDIEWTDRQIYVSYYFDDNSEPLMIELRPVYEDRLQYEKDSHYGIQRFASKIVYAR